MAVQPSYLTCSAAQASAFNQTHPHEFLSLNQLLEGRAASHPDVCIAGFPELHDGYWNSIELTFASLLAASNRVALHLLSITTLLERTQGDMSKRIVALLSPSCVDLLVTLFAALRLGYGALLLAPQNMPDANAHLCRATGATHLICHASLTEQGGIARNGLTSVGIVQMPERNIWYGQHFEEPLISTALSPEEEQDLPALVMHTSGSTGMPKPIYQSHRVWTQAIPCMPGKPAFTTTPLFHGGTADFLRSINALSTLYFFSSLYPITVTNVVNAISACRDVTAFLSVPYILKMLAENMEGLEMLRRMELVSTGGAPLPQSLGDEMVQRGVKLVSRLGSSECGFLMSSHRDYDNDKQWSWLRNHNVSEALLRFEPVGDSEGMYELIVGKDWSTLVVSNREDGSFASGDLYAKHPTISDAWRYAGRVDDMIVMTNGKKASANPIESALRACPEISEAIVFGASRPSLGVIVVPASTSVTRAVVLDYIHAVNQTVPTYANVLDELVIVLPPDADLPKTSKGSVVRPRALKQHASVINDAYRRLEGVSGSAPDEALEDEDGVKCYIKNAIVQVMKQHPRTTTKLPLADDDDLFNAGVDSLQASAIQRVVQKVVGSGKTLPGNIIFEYPSIEKLSKHISDILFDNEVSRTASDDEEAYKTMRELLERFSSPFVGVALQTTNKPLTGCGVAVLTGATGSLGAHVLSRLLGTTRYHVVALLRAQDGVDALRRVQDNMKRRKLHISEPDSNRFTVLVADLAQERLGLPQETYDGLLRDVEIILHVAWPVNFAYGLESFVPILQGTQNLITLAAHAAAPAKLVSCSSVAAASNSPSDGSSNPSTVYETLPHSESCAAPLGYARAKWVAEHLCSAAQGSVLPGGRMSIARVGQLCGDTVHGVWSESEAWPLLVASVKYTGCLPEFEMSISLLPVDVAAFALLDLVSTNEDDIERHSIITHITNPHTIPWPSFLSALERAGLQFQRVRPTQWIAELEAQSESLDASTKSLVPMWKSKFCGERVAPEPMCDVTNAQRVSASMRDVKPVSDELVARFVARWRGSRFLHDKEV